VNDFNLAIPASLLDAIVEAVTERVLERLLAGQTSSSPWLSGAQAAADYLGWPRERVYKNLARLPHYRDEGRLMFRRDELDASIEQHRERR
jgi:hypothetical protein